jgi:hypothetical protein
VQSRELNKVEGTEQYYVENSNGFAALKNLDKEVDINRAWEAVRDNNKISANKSNIDAIKKNRDTLIDSIKEVGLEVNMEKTKYIQGVPGGMCQTSGGCSLC